MKTYKEDPAYDKKKEDIKNEIRRMKEDREHIYGGAFVHLYDLIEKMDKNNLFAKAQKLAKQQGKEEIVNRLIKVAEKYGRFNIFSVRHNEDVASGVYAGMLISMGGLYFAAPVVAAGGAVLAAASMAYVKKQNEDLNKIEKAHFTLKNYVKSGDLKKAQQRALEVDKRMRKILKTRVDNAFKLKNLLNTRTGR